MVKSGGCMGWLKQRTNLEKTLLSLSSLLILTLLLLIFIRISAHDPDPGDDSRDNFGCTTKECIITAGQVLPIMDETANPCEDFYGYACGLYGGKPGQTSSATQTSVEAVYRHIKELLESPKKVEVPHFDRARSLYTACMQFDGIPQNSAEVLLELMDRFGLGNWPVISTVYKETELTISERLANLALLGVPVAFSAEVVPDPHTWGAFLLKLSPGSPVEVSRHANHTGKDPVSDAYILISLLLLGAPNYLRAKNAMQDILHVNKYFDEVEQDFGTSCDTVDTLTPEESLSKLNLLIPEMNWTYLVSSIQHETGIQRPFAVEVHCKKKIKDLLNHLKEEIRKSKNYLGWRFFDSFAQHISPIFGRPQSQAELRALRWKECVLLVEKYGGPLLETALRHLFIHPETENKVQRVSRNVLTAAEMLLPQSNWLSRDQKERIAQQVQTAKETLTDAPRMNGSALAHLRLPEVPDENYTAMVIDLRKARVVQNLMQLYPETLSEQPSLPWERYLTSEAATRSLVFDKMREPYLRTQGPDWMNYGGYGVFAARQHSADFLPDGPGGTSEESTTLWDLWSNDPTASACVRNLSSQHFRDNLLRMDGDGEKTLLKEIFLDIGALEIALEGAELFAESSSFLPGMADRTDAQMFFIAYAQTWCEEKHSKKNTDRIPVRNRVNTLVSNSHAFNKAFSCSTSSVAEKCRIWS